MSDQLNETQKFLHSLRASSGKKIDSHRCAPNTWVSLEELLTFTSQNSPEPKKRECSTILARGVVGLYEYIVNRISCQDTHHARQHIYNTFNTQYHEINHAMQTDTNNNMDATAHVLM